MDSKDRMARWLSRLVRVPSVNPAQSGPRAGVAGEGRIAAELTRCFAEAGATEVVMEEVHPGRPNVYGIWKGASDKWVAVDVHTDTVGVEQMTGDPFDGAIRDGKVWGRGAVDTKATFGVVLALLEDLHQSGRTPRPNVIVAATVDEETTGTGAPAFAAWLKRRNIEPAEIAVAEPTDCVPIYGHKGVVRMEFTFQGVPAHTSQPERGQNAVHAAAEVIVAFQREHERLDRECARPPLGAPKLTVSLIQGGNGINIVPPECTISLDRRVIDGERASKVVEQLVDLARRTSPLPFTWHRLVELDAFLQRSDTPWVRSMAEWCGAAPAVAPYGTNAWAYVGMKSECLIVGPGSINQSHGTEEWVTLAELDKMAGIYRRWWGLS